MFGFLLADGNFPFAVALGLMLGIAVLEGTMTLLGAGMSQAIDSMLPGGLDGADAGLEGEFDISSAPDAIDGTGADFGDASLSANQPQAGDIGSPSALSRLLGWLCVGKVPVLVLLVAFLTMFGLSGLAIQSMSASVTGATLPSALASIPAFLVALPCVRVIGRGLARIIPKDETTAVGRASFIGRIATITVGTATHVQPAQAKLNDQFGQTHYVMVAPETTGDVFETGTEVLLVRKNPSKSGFVAIRNTNPALVDGP